MYICPNCGNQYFEIEIPTKLTFNTKGNIIATENLDVFINKDLDEIFMDANFEDVTCTHCNQSFYIHELEEDEEND